MYSFFSKSIDLSKSSNRQINTERKNSQKFLTKWGRFYEHDKWGMPIIYDEWKTKYNGQYRVQ